MHFCFESPLVLEETQRDYVVVEATLLTEGVSTKNFLYTVGDTDFHMVAETAANKPVYYGVNIFGEHNAPPIAGDWVQEKSGIYNKNAKPIGKIVKSWFDDKLRRVKAKIKIWDSDLMNRVKKGFKVSVRGLFDGFKEVLLGSKLVKKIINLRIHDVQLVPPEAKTGVEGAKVERVLEETMSFFGADSDLEDVAIIAKLVEEGYII